MHTRTLAHCLSAVREVSMYTPTHMQHGPLPPDVHKRLPPAQKPPTPNRTKQSPHKGRQ